MRNRLTAAFVLLSVLLLVGGASVRGFVLRDLVREQESAHVRQQAELVARIVNARETSGGVIDRRLLEELVARDSRLTYDPHRGPGVVVHGEGYDGTGRGDDISATVTVFDGVVTVGQSPEVVSDVLGRDLGAALVLLAVLATVAGLLGWLFARLLSAPFRQLAVAAAALGRGRFDLDLPRTSIPEARAIASALRTSAGQLEDRIHREREFAEQASHVLRTPLTGLRLELEELSLREDLPRDARETAGRGLQSLDTMNAVAGELVELSRGGTLVAGAEVRLVDLATSVAQRWADRLAVRNRTLTASVDGDLDLTYTPGPVEQVLDLLLTDVVDRGTGAARIVFLGQDGGHLRVRVSAEGVARAEPTAALAEAREVAESLGGRIIGEDLSRTIVVLFPRR